MSEQTIYVNNGTDILTISDNNYTNTIIQALVGPEGKTGPAGPSGPPGPRGPRGRAAPFYPRTVYATQTLNLEAGSNTLPEFNASWIKVSGVAGSEIGGIHAGAEGELRILTNTSDYSIIIKHNDSSIISNKRILNFNNANITLLSNMSINLIYDASAEKWRTITISHIGA